jgi:hypothetical protein
MWPSKVIGRIEGGLGNQLFQYAAARSLADRLECELALDLRGLQENGDRGYMLDRFAIRATVATTDELRNLPTWRSSRMGRLRSRASQRFTSLLSFPVFWPESFAYDARFERIPRPVYLVGYWQSEKYFAWNRGRLLSDFSSVQPIEESTLLKVIRNTTSVALHIRRGDYVTNPQAAKFHGLCDLSYYQAAIDGLVTRFPELQVFAFSDDPGWVRRNLRLNVPLQVMDACSAYDAHIDLELMSNCRHHVIANSSFSWWGAWRAVSSDQVVYAPRRWFDDANTDTSDVIPARWKQID